MNNYGYQHYKQQSVNTMTQGELLILLFDECIKRLSAAEIALKTENNALFETSIDRATEIVRYLNRTLDKNYPIWLEITRLYDFFLFEFARVKAGRNAAIIAEVKPLVLDLRNTFKEADRLAQAEVVGS